MVSSKMFPISASKQSLRLDFRPFYHQVLEDYLKLKLPCYCCFWSSLKMYDRNQTMQRRVRVLDAQPIFQSTKGKIKKGCLNTSAGNERFNSLVRLNTCACLHAFEHTARLSRTLCTRAPARQRAPSSTPRKFCDMSFVLPIGWKVQNMMVDQEAKSKQLSNLIIFQL